MDRVNLKIRMIEKPLFFFFFERIKIKLFFIHRYAINAFDPTKVKLLNKISQRFKFFTRLVLND